MQTRSHVTVRAVRMKQAGHDLYLFSLPGERLLEIATISRLERDAAGEIEGYQRGEIRHHVRDIAEYLQNGDVLFPNPLLFAFGPDVRFVAARGPDPDGLVAAADAGTLRIPLGRRPAGWIVDGQQRALALAKSGSRIQVPVVAFVSADLAVHREQFVLVNKARPLPRALVDVLLPGMDAALLPKDLGPRRIPSVLVEALDTNRDSPLRDLIRRPGKTGGVVSDQALLKAIRRSIGSPLGALSPYAHPGEPDVHSMYVILSGFWSAVRDAFPEAWGKPPAESRLMHSAGIDAMSCLMDRVLGRPDAASQPRASAAAAMDRIAPDRRWTGGRWEDLGLAWNEVECTPRSVARLRDLLIRLEHGPRLAA